MSAESGICENLEEACGAAGGDEKTEKDEFLIIENGDKMKKEVEKIHDEFRDQVLMFSRELDSLWRLIKDFMRLAGPTLLCLVSLLLTRFIVSKKFQPMVLSSLLGCAVATILVYSAPFMISFHKYRRIRHERVKKLSNILLKESNENDPEKVDSDTQTSESDVHNSANSSDTEVETIANPSSSGSNTSEANDASAQPSIEIIGSAEPRELCNELKSSCKKTKICASPKTCDCC